MTVQQTPDLTINLRSINQAKEIGPDGSVLSVHIRAASWGAAEVALEWSIEGQDWQPVEDESGHAIVLNVGRPSVRGINVFGAPRLRVRVTVIDSTATEDAIVERQLTAARQIYNASESPQLITNTGELDESTEVTIWASPPDGFVDVVKLVHVDQQDITEQTISLSIKTSGGVYIGWPAIDVAAQDALDIHDLIITPDLSIVATAGAKSSNDPTFYAMGERWRARG